MIFAARRAGLPIEEKLPESLEKHGWNAEDAPVFIQSFKPANLKVLRKKTRVRLIQLGADVVFTDYPDIGVRVYRPEAPR